MPLILDDAEQAFNPLAPVGKPEGLIVTRDQFSPPVSDGGRPWADTFGEKGTPSFGETLRSSFEQENWLIGPLLKPAEDRDFGPEDRDHNPWDTIKGTKYQDHWQSFVSSRNSAETEAIRARIEHELENRRLREASGVTGFVTDIIAGMTDPFVLLPGGALYKGFGAANRVKSALSVGASAAGSVALSELALHQQQYTRTWQESMFNIGGATVLGGLLGGGASYFGSRALARASRAIDDDLARIRTETADIASLTARGDPQAAGAAPARVVADNVLEGAYGVERAFSWQGPMTRVLANEIRAARDVMTRLAEIPLRLRQNAEGIATGPAGGSVESRIKVDGDVAMYRASESLHKAFAEYRYGNPDAKFAKSAAAFADMLKPQQGRLGWREFKSEVTKALRSQTEKGIDHPNPHVKAAAESFRRDVFEPFKKEAQKLGLFPEDAEFSFNYVMRRYDVNAILNDYARFKQILVDHLKGGQARARAELAAVEREIAASRTEGDMSGEIDALSKQFEAERARVMEARSAQDNVKASQAEDAAYLDELTKAKADTPEGKAALDAERLDVETRMADEKAAGKRSEPGEDGGDPVFASRMADEQMVRDLLEKGRVYKLTDEDIVGQFMAFEPYADLLPPGSRFGAWASLAPVAGEPGMAIATFRFDGGEIAIKASADNWIGARAMYLPDDDIVIPFSVLGLDDTGHEIASGIYHELAHAAWTRLGPVERARLAVHAESLGVMKMVYRDVLRLTGDPTWQKADPTWTTEKLYRESIYGSKDYDAAREDLLAQESVAFMQELHYAGHFTDAQVAPVLDMLMNMRGGDVRGKPGGGGPLFAFGGARAQGADLGALAAAQRLASRGKPMADIFKQTGWFQGGDGRWRFEIDDSKATLKDDAFRVPGSPMAAAPSAKEPQSFWSWLTGKAKPAGGASVVELVKAVPAWAKGDVRVARTKLSDLLDHPELYKHYPFLATEMRVNMLIGKGIPEDKLGGRLSTYKKGTTTVYEPIRVIARTKEEGLNTLLHEVQHYIQRKEGWPSGSKPNDLPKQAPGGAEPRIYSPNTRLASERMGRRSLSDGTQMLSSRTHAESRVKDIRRGMEEGQDDDILDIYQNEMRKLMHIDGDSYKLDAGEREADLTMDRRTMSAEERRNSLPDYGKVYDTSKPMTFRDAADKVAESEAKTVAMERRWAEPVEVTKGMVAERQGENYVLFRHEDGTELFDVDLYPGIAGAEIRMAGGIDDGALERLLQMPPAEQKRLAEAAIEYTRKTYNSRVSFAELTDEEFPFWYAIRPEVGVGDIRAVLPTLERHFKEKFGPDTRLERADHDNFYVDVGKYGEIKRYASWDDEVGEWEHLVPEWSMLYRRLLDDDTKPKGLDDEAWRARSGPLFAAGAPEPPKIELDPAVISAVEGMAARLGIQMPDLKGLDLDAMMQAVAKSISDMTGMGKATGNTADLKALHAKAEELRWIADASDKQLDAMAGETISTITGTPSARGVNPYAAELLQGPSGPLKARTLKIPDEKIVDFLDDDIERIALQYVRSMAPDVALAREFGDINLTEDLKRIQDEAENLKSAHPERAKQIDDQVKSAQKDLMAVAARLRGTLNIAHDPTSLGPRAAQAVKQGNVLRLMGAVIAASISDVPKLLFVHGFRQNADLFSTLVTHLDGLKMAKAEAKELSAGLEFVLSRSGQLWDAFEDMAGHTMPERALRVATNKFGRLTLMDQWNATWKQLSGIMTMNRVLRHSVDLMNGRLNAKDLGKLAASGIDEALAERIAAQYQQHGTVYGRLFLANANEWDDPLARQALAAAVRREADITITTPGQERPIWTSKTYGSVVGQFRTFQLVSIQRTLIAGLQEMDAAKVTAIAGMIALGMLSEQLKMIIHGKENKPGKPKDLGDWMYVGLANSGVLGWLTDADQTAHKISRGNISLGKFAFGKDEPISRFASQNWVGALTGPTYGAALDVGLAIGAASSGQLREADIHAMRRLAPYQNLFYISRALREFEEGMIDAMGVPRTQRRN